MSPCTLLVEREFAITLPASCLFGVLSGMRSTKLVSSRLKPVVCELAMLPEMFSSAKDCARMPVTAVVRAPKIPMTRLHLRWPQTHDAIGPQQRRPRCKRRATEKADIFQLFMENRLRRAGQDAPPPGRNCRPKLPSGRT